jgi:PHD/YefM family antitoxin component YafN of YafNO toxin-antitoxin module
MVTYASNELIASSELVKKFGSYLSQLKESSTSKLAILRNNKVEAVLVSKDEYEKMVEALKKVQGAEILLSIQKGLDDVKQGRVSPIESLWDELDEQERINILKTYMDNQ